MSKQAEFAVILKMNPMFADLGADELQRISALCHTQHLNTGEMLFQKGDPGDALFGVRRGQIRIETGVSDGSRLTLNFLGPGDLLARSRCLTARAAPPMPPPASRPNCSCCGARIFSAISNANPVSRSS
jgi:signal-transduction protein with cAMP-binding, CBS, and nucleotidyltransferase domain